MKSLILVRHAKSSWESPGLGDHDRPLNERGRHDAPRMAQRLADEGAAPEVILSSTAVRARTTAVVFADALGVEIELDERLYGASTTMLQRVIAERGAASVLVVAHDPGLSMLAGALATDITHMPTCAVARFQWNTGSWGDAFGAAPDAWSFDEPRAS